MTQLVVLCGTGGHEDLGDGGHGRHVPGGWRHSGLRVGALHHAEDTLMRLLDGGALWVARTRPERGLLPVARSGLEYVGRELEAAGALEVLDFADDAVIEHVAGGEHEHATGRDQIARQDHTSLHGI